MAGKRNHVSITLPRGFHAAAATCGIKASGKADLALIVSDRSCVAAGVFTRNRFPGAPLVVTRKHLGGGGARAIVCNSGNANASTGKRGVKDAFDMARYVARELGCEAKQVFVASTGVIGRFLPMAKVERGIAHAMLHLGRGRSADAHAARAIMTTDLAPKATSRVIRLGNRTVHLGGIAKGSGMIAPNMGTMLAFISTDAAITAASLRQSLLVAAGSTFNRISVDQHTSPSDMALVLANGAAENRPIHVGNREHVTFTNALTDLCRELADMIVADGEGATKVFRVRVVGAASERDADRVGRAVVDSPLVKTAVHGGDPNWGRIVTAAGYSGAALDPDRVSLHIGAENGRKRATDVCVFRRGQPAALDARAGRKLASAMRGKRLRFTLDLHQGDAGVEWLGCDLSRQYVAINADYTT